MRLAPGDELAPRGSAMTRSLAALGLIVLASGMCAVSSAQVGGPAGCEPDWLPTFGTAPGVSGMVTSLCRFDDGGGADLYVGGNFQEAGGVVAHSIASWDGSEWS